MKQIKANLTAGQEVSFSIVGNYFRILEGGGDVVVRFPDLGIATTLKAGIGIQLDRFDEVTILSESNQKIVFAAAVGRVDDSRLTGTISASLVGGSSYSAPSVIALAAGVSKEILAQDLTRLKATMQPENDIYLGASAAVTTANGIKLLTDNTVETDNSAAVWAICAVASNVRVLEEF